MSAALAATEAGHRVILVGKEDRLGGQLHLAGAPPGREEFVELARDLERQLALKSIQVVLNQAVDAAFIQKEKPDAAPKAVAQFSESFSGKKLDDRFYN